MDEARTGVTVTLGLSAGGNEPEVLVFLPAGVSLSDAAKIAKAMAKVFPDAVARTDGLPPGMAMAILRR